MVTLQELYDGNNQITKNLKLSKITIRDVVSYGEETYMLFLMLFCSKPFDLIPFLQKKEIREDEITQYELFQLLIEGYWEVPSVRKLISFFLNIDSLKKLEIKGEIIFVDPTTTKIILTEDIFLEVSKRVSNMSRYKNKKVEKFANEFTRELYIEDLLDELEDSKDDDFGSPYSSLVTAIVVITSYDYNTVWDLTMYQFHSLINSIARHDEFMNIMGGVYSGNVDTKKIKLDKYNWLVDNNKED